MSKRDREVLSCPFCGHPAEVTEGLTFKCVSCSYGACPAKPLVKSGKVEDAIALWNTRPEATLPAKPDQPVTSATAKGFWRLS